MTRDRVIAIAQTVTMLIFMSLGTVITKLTLSDVSPLTFTWVSLLIGGSVLITYTFVIRREKIPTNLSRQVWLYIIAIGFFNFVVSMKDAEWSCTGSGCCNPTMAYRREADCTSSSQIAFCAWMDIISTKRNRTGTQSFIRPLTLRRRDRVNGHIQCSGGDRHPTVWSTCSATPQGGTASSAVSPSRGSRSRRYDMPRRPS